MDDPLRGFPGYALRRASARWISDYGQRLVPLALTFSEASVLMVIDANPRITLSAIGRMLDIKRANMTPLIARLEARELIDRVSVDGRAHGLSLNAAGKALQRQICIAIQSHEAALLDRVPEHLRGPMLPILYALWED